MGFLATLVAALLASFGTSVAQQETSPPVLVHPSSLRSSDDTVTIEALGSQVSFLPGLGWTTGWTLPGPETTEAGVRVSRAVAGLLRLPRIDDVRSALTDTGVRIVVDLADLSEEAWRQDGPLARRDGILSSRSSLEWRLPATSLPASAAEGAIFVRDTFRLDARFEGGETLVTLSGADAEVTVFPLREPDRLVIDLRPRASDDARAAIEPASVAYGLGVAYQRLQAVGREGPSVVHLLELDPREVALRVVGRSGEGRTVAGWADGGVAAINAGYFDPRTFSAIGLRRIDGSLLSWPSRNRAVVGFGPDGTVVERAGARAQVDVDGVRVADLRLDGNDDLEWSGVAGTQVGSARVGVLVIGSGGVVQSNTIGPRPVPQGGSALAYPAEIRPLALVEPGQRVTVGARLLPDALEATPWAVEAGPLLVAQGRPAFLPESEGFARGQRILDEATQQAALGVRPDGTVLFVVAERMIAEDLVPLFLRLGAESALRLDSGSSATLVAEGRTLNRLLARPVESAIVAVPHETDAPPR